MSSTGEPAQTKTIGDFARRFAIREPVIVATVAGDDLSWAMGVVVGVTYGNAPLYDVRLNDSDTIVQQVPTERIVDPQRA